MLKNLLYAVGLALSLAVASGRAEVPPQPSTAPAEPDKLTGGDDLGKHQAALAQIRESLARHNLTAAELQALREQIDRLSDSIRATLERLESHLAAIKERLDQLGPKPDAKAPRESPAVTAERTSQQKSYADISEVEAGPCAAAEAEQTRTSITTGRRRPLTRSLFTKSASIAARHSDRGHA